MIAKSAVILIPSDAARPMMLQRAMGTPLLTWLAASLESNGVSRCFLVSPDRFLEEACACIPEAIELTCTADRNSPDLLHDFLSASEGEEVLVITGPAVYVPGNAILTEEDYTDAPTGVCTVSHAALQSALNEDFSFATFLADHSTACAEEDGFFAVTAPDELADWQPILKRLYLYGLAAQGVEIWDYDNCYIEPTVRIGAGTEILPGTILRGKTVIGEGCSIGPNTLLENATIGNGTSINSSQIYDSSVGNKTAVGPFAFVRPGCKIGDNIKIGDFVEVKNSVIGNGTKVAHLTYIGDSDVGERINFGCGTVTVNYDRAKKFRTTIEDDAFVGCNANLVAPVTIGRGAYIAAGSTITEDIPAQALGIARARQSVKEEWAAKHKIKGK